MISPPGAAQIGTRLTIALQDSQGNTEELLGVLHDVRTIRKRDGSLASFDPNSITHWRVVKKVNAKAGFGAPLSMRIRELEAAATTTWPADVTTEYGNWLLRASEGDTRQGNSVIPTGARPFGDPGMEIEVALIEVANFYHQQGLTPGITVPLPAYPKLDEYLAAQGWHLSTELHCMVIDTSDFTPRTTDSQFTVKISDEPTDTWLAVQGDMALAKIMRRYWAHYISVLIEGQRVATGRIAFTGGWGVITRVFVKHEYRRQGIGRIVMHTLAEVARAQDCDRLTLQVDSSNSPAVSLCNSLGFRLHHRDRYRVLE
jgi:N-acetylglutamate synthase